MQTRFWSLIITIGVWGTIYLPALGSLEIKGEEGSQNVVTRADVGPMREACARWSKAT